MPGIGEGNLSSGCVNSDRHQENSASHANPQGSTKGLLPVEA